MNTWNYTTEYKLFVLDRNTWYNGVQKLHKRCKYKPTMNVITKPWSIK